MAQPIKQIVIVGGGTAGWMTAAYLANWLESTDISVQLVESDQIGTIGVGEATIPGIHQFIRELNIDEKEFIKATNGTFKLGIEFENWAGENTRFFHPFADYGISLEERHFYKTWLSARRQGLDLGLEKFCLGAQLARAGKFALPNFEEESRLAWYNYAFHFDASLFAKYLREFAEARSVKRTEGKVKKIELDPNSGFIDSLHLEDGNLIQGDLFVDCTGIAALLIGKTMGVEFDDWSHWLPCDSALAVQTKEQSSPDPFTRSTTRTAGWQWHIPLQNRVGNGYVYSSQFISDDLAKDELLNNLQGECITQPKLIKFKTGMRNEFWRKNCVSIGLSSGFLEPLESTSISLIQTGIAKLTAFLINFEIDEKNIAEANRLNKLEYERIRDFIILHYKLNGRSEPFWQGVREMNIPATLEEKIEVFRMSGDIKLIEQESFQTESWISMFYGFGVEPTNIQPNNDWSRIQRLLNSMADAIQKGLLYAPLHGDFLKTVD
jgi:tryptophan 7-halogenase